MSLEQAINENTAAVRELIVKLDTKFAAPASNGEDTAVVKRGPGRPAKPSASAVTLEMAQAAGKKILDAFGKEEGRPKALKLIKEHGADRIADMDPSKYASFCAAVDVLLAQRQKPEEPAGEDDDEI